MSDIKGVSQSLIAQRRLGYICLAVIVLFVLGWGGLSNLSGAVIAPGRISVESSLKRIQHREGGIVREVTVRDGDKVVAGQVLVRLDSTVTGANAAIVQGQLWQLQARRLRLEAERRGLTRIEVPDDSARSPEFDDILLAEQALLTTRIQMRGQRKSQLGEQISQANHEIDGLKAQMQAQAQQHKLIVSELQSVRQLHEQGYVPVSRVNQLEREAERLQGERGQFEASAARTATRISEIRMMMLQVDSVALTEIMDGLKDTETRLAQLGEQRVMTEDAMRRIDIKAPVSGRVQQLMVHTSGGVVAPGETLMLVVPDTDDLIVEARIDPQNVDQVQVGKKAFVRFTSFASQTTPEGEGRVDMISADVETDEKTGISYYKARLILKPMALSRELRTKLVAGMPVEVQIETARRNALSYFLKPLTDQMSRTFRED